MLRWRVVILYNQALLLSVETGKQYGVTDIGHLRSYLWYEIAVLIGWGKYLSSKHRNFSK